jgi:hypothetical protein
MLSPGVQVDTIDLSPYSSGTSGTVPLVIIATAANKLNPTGTLANYTIPGNGPTLYTVVGQQDLTNNFGVPNFTKDASGNVIYGSETSEMGLLALYSALGLINNAYVIRADIDLAQLTGSAVRPTGPAPGGTMWLDTAITLWGIFQWNDTTQTFNQATVITITDDSLLIGNPGVPTPSLGSVGNYAVVATNTSNPTYYKNRANTWVLVGSNAWQQSFASNKAATPSINNLTPGNVLVVNTINVTLTSNTDVALAGAINAATIPGVTAGIVNSTLELYVTSAATSDGTHVDGKLVLANGTGTPLTVLGMQQNSFCPQVQITPHTLVPYWKATDTTPRPGGSVWVKTTPVNYGANLPINQWNSVTGQWTTLTAPLYANTATALYQLDPKLGGLGINLDSLYVQYDVLNNGTVTYEIMECVSTGPLVVTGNNNNPSFTVGDSFSISTSQVGSPTLTTPVTITINGITTASVVSAILAANIPNVSASVGNKGNLVITQLNGGDLILANVTNTPLTVAGITNQLGNVTNGLNSTLVGSNWAVATYVAQPTPPVTAPANGTLWYAASPMEVDIMINDGSVWRGYQNLNMDTRGFPLAHTDKNGPQISPTPPTRQSDGTALVFGDLWINTSILENYPVINRWQSVSGIPQWVVLNNADSTTENGIIFADARWDTDGTSDVVLDPIPSIASLLVSDYLDLDAPDPTLYPRGCLLFNTRRSNYNVKKYALNYFGFENYPLESIPAQTSTWVSASGRDPYNVPYFGRKAVRNMVVGAMRSAIDSSVQVREEAYVFNLICAPGYPELMANMTALNNDRSNTGFIIGDLPIDLSSDSTILNNYITNAVGVSVDSEEGLVNADPFTAVYYPSACLTNDLSGNTVLQPASHMMLSTIIKNDLNNYPWIAPAGELNGLVNNAAQIGYINRQTGTFISVGCGQGVRNLLYPNNVNPIAVFPGSGIMAYGQKTRQRATTAMDRINVARLIAYMRYQLAVISKPFLFQPNDQITRSSLKASVDSLCNDLVATRALYDYLTVCDKSNNTNAVIMQSQLIIDVAIEPEKAAEFIIIPLMVMNPGSIASGQASAIIANNPLA